MDIIISQFNYSPWLCKNGAPFLISYGFIHINIYYYKYINIQISIFEQEDHSNVKKIERMANKIF